MVDRDDAVSANFEITTVAVGLWFIRGVSVGRINSA